MDKQLNCDDVQDRGCLDAYFRRIFVHLIYFHHNFSAGEHLLIVVIVAANVLLQTTVT
jgi:hypothetical protein